MKNKQKLSPIKKKILAKFRPLQMNNNNLCRTQGAKMPKPLNREKYKNKQIDNIKGRYYM